MTMARRGSPEESGTRSFIETTVTEGTSLRYDPRICQIAGALALVQYAAVVGYADWRWDLNAGAIFTKAELGGFHPVVRVTYTDSRTQRVGETTVTLTGYAPTVTLEATSTVNSWFPRLTDYEIRAVSGGEHPDWDEYRAAMVTDKRLILTIRPTRAYGMDLRTGDSPTGRDERHR